MDWTIEKTRLEQEFSNYAGIISKSGKADESIEFNLSAWERAYAYACKMADQQNGTARSSISYVMPGAVNAS